MSVVLEGTNSSAVNAAIQDERRRVGATTAGVVLTLVIVSDEQNQSEATRAATTAVNQHPCRILVVIPRPGRGAPLLDAEISVGERGGPGETVKLRLLGPLAGELQSVVLPLLLPDTPVVAWWTAKCPLVPAADQVGLLAGRRVTDASEARKPYKALAERAASYQPGDTDLAWTRITPWRSMLATALDEPFDPVQSAEVRVARSNASGPLLAAWLKARLQIPVNVAFSRGPGITGVTLDTESGPIVLNRPDGRMAGLVRPGSSRARQFPMARRDLRDLISEELNRLDADEIYEAALAQLDAIKMPQKKVSSGQRVTASKVPKPRGSAQQLKRLPNRGTEAAPKTQGKKSTP